MPGRTATGPIPVSLFRKLVASGPQPPCARQVAMPLASYRWASCGPVTARRTASTARARGAPPGPGRGIGARSARSSLCLQCRLRPRRGGGLAHVGEDQVFQARPGRPSRRGRGSGCRRGPEGALPVGAAGRRDLPAGRAGWPGRGGGPVSRRWVASSSRPARPPGPGRRRGRSGSRRPAPGRRPGARRARR